MSRGLNKNITVSSGVEAFVIYTFKGCTKKQLKARTIAICNLLAAEGTWVSYERANKPVESRRYNKYQLSNRVFKDSVDDLVKEGLAEAVTGTASEYEDFQSPSMMKATERLLGLFPVSEVDYMKKEYIKTLETLILKDSEKEIVEYNDTRILDKMRTVVRRLNATNSRHEFVYNGKLLNNSGLVRIFNNNSFELGGRFYRAGAHTITQRALDGSSLPLEKTRLGITIDGEAVVEVDYKSFHPLLLCAIHDLPADKYYGDIYSAMVPFSSYPLDRSLFKNAVLWLLNSQSMQVGLSVIQKEINFNPGRYSYTSAKDVYNRVVEVAPELESFLCKEDSSGLYLQYLDSCIAEKVVEQFVNLDKPIIPVHDSYVVKWSDEGALCDAMKDAFRLVTKNYSVKVGLKISRWNGEVLNMICQGNF